MRKMYLFIDSLIVIIGLYFIGDYIFKENLKNLHEISTIAHDYSNNSINMIFYGIALSIAGLIFLYLDIKIYKKKWKEALKNNTNKKA